MLRADYTYDNEGRRLTMKYPDAYSATFAPLPGPQFHYSYDSMGRPWSMGSGGLGFVQNATYNVAGQMTSWEYAKDFGAYWTNWYTETRTFNVLGQMTAQQVAGNGTTVLDLAWTYPATQNNGRVDSVRDGAETVTMTYDSLLRLTRAAGNQGWGQSFQYDGFGNRASLQTDGYNAVSTAFDANNRITGPGTYVHDGNGNLTSMPNPLGSGQLTLAYDIANRVISASNPATGTETYQYYAGNQRMTKTRNGVTEYFFYGAGGELLGTYTQAYQGASLRFIRKEQRVWFGSRLIRIIKDQGNVQEAIIQDRLGSVVFQAGTRYKYAPYGEERPAATGNSREKFATYYRDETGLDYAVNRYYAFTTGRFTSPDPYIASGGPSDPGSWNRYGYVENNPVSYVDPSGLMLRAPSNSPCGDNWMWDASLSGPCSYGWGGSWEWWDGGGCGGGGSGFRPVTSAERQKYEGDVNTLLTAAWLAGASSAQGGAAYPKYLRLMSDNYSCWGNVVQRNVQYQLYDSADRPLGSGVVTEHLYPTDYDAPIITRPGVNTSSGENFGVFNDEISIQFGSPRTYLQNFTARGSTASLVGFVDIPVYVVGFGGTYGILSITKTATYVEINGNRRNVKKCD